MDEIINKLNGKIIKSNRRFFIKHNENIYEEDVSTGNTDTKDCLLKIITSNELLPMIYSRNALKLLMVYIDNDKTFVDKLWYSNLYKLCFKNGYYDFKQMIFKEYDEDTYSTICINYDFPERNEDKINELYETVLNPIFCNKEQQKYYLNWCSRGLAGHYTEKTYGCSIGLHNSGKSVLYELFKVTFQEYVSVFNPIEMKCRGRRYGDLLKKMSWMIPFEFKRLMFSYELNTDDETCKKFKLDGDILKGIASGGDDKMARLKNKNTIQFKIQGRIMLIMNKMIEISPTDAMETMDVFKFQTTFVNELTEEHEKINKEGQFKFIKADEKIKEKIQLDEGLRNAFVHIILENYSNPKIEKNNMYQDKNEEQIKAIFEFTKNYTDCVEVSKVDELMKLNTNLHKITYTMIFDKLGAVPKIINDTSTNFKTIKLYSKIKIKHSK